MNAYLLDTHVVLWLATDSQRVPPTLRAQLEKANRLCVSAASVYELSQKVRLGKLSAAASLLARWPELLQAMMAEELPLTSAEMQRAGSMTWAHRDPFDRMLVAQAQLNGLQLVTRDELIREFSEVSCADWV